MKSFGPISKKDIFVPNAEMNFCGKIQVVLFYSENKPQLFQGPFITDFKHQHASHFIKWFIKCLFIMRTRYANHFLSPANDLGMT